MSAGRTFGEDLQEDDLSQRILSEYPYPIAVNYRRLLEATNWEARTRRCIELFEYTLRTVTLVLISQYLILDRNKVKDATLNELLQDKFARASLGIWNDIFFRTLQAYQGKKKRFFVPELYDFYWDVSKSPHRKRKGIRPPFDRLINIRNELTHGVPPFDEEGWQFVCEESLSLLREILGQFTFLSSYDLIRIRRAGGGGKYWYDIYTGEHLSPSQLLTTQEVLTEGWLYLERRKDTGFLEMHPLLVFWEELANVDQVYDTALFAKYQSNGVTYSATVAGANPMLKDRTLMAEFFYTVYHTLEKVKVARREAQKLTWGLLKEVADKISSQRAGDVRNKYQPEVYLQRSETRDNFQAFLASDKTCLVLIGKSGVGKSNFFGSLMDEYQGSNEICTMMYNGARLSTEVGMAEALAQDFLSHLNLEGFAEEEKFGDILSEINRIEGIADRQVVLLIDALNENPEAKRLLRRVDALVGDNSYPWLKVVISSRPETWRTIRRRVQLAEHKYYQEGQTGELGVELQPFEVEVKPFGVEELQIAYTNYRRVYELQTDYQQVPPEVRQMLRDPLTLWLVAVTYRGQEIPQDLKAQELIKQYIDALIDTARLYVEDIQFLEQELMPLMIREGAYANAITGEMVDEAQTADGKSLFELIYSDGLLSSGRRVNESFANLVNADILIHQRAGLDRQIAFKYERFYDYFAGARLFELHHQSADIQGSYHNLARKVRAQPFLWGATVRALLLELGEGNRQLLINLASTRENLANDLLVMALVEYAQEQPGTVNGILEDLLAGGSDEETPKRIALEVASKLSILGILERAAADPSASIRAMAVKHIFYLSRSNRANSLQILRQLASKAMLRWRIPNRDIVESTAVISLLLFFTYADDERVTQEIQTVWRDILARLLPFSSDRQTWWGRTTRQAQSWLFSMAVRIMVRVAGTFEESEAMVFSVSEIKAFFGDNQKKKPYTQLVPYLDVEHGSIKDVQELLVQCAKENDQLTMYLVTAIFAAHSIREKEVTLRVADQVFEGAMSPQKPTSYVPALLLALATAIYSETSGVDADLWKTYKSYVKEFYQKSHNVCEGTLKRHRWTEQSRYLIMFYEQFGHMDSVVVNDFLTDVEERKDWVCLSLYVAGMAEHTARFGFKAQYLEQLLTFLKHDREEIRNSAIAALAKIRTYYRRELDEFLEAYDVDQTVQQMIRAKETGENFGHLMVRSAYQFSRDRFVIASEAGITQHVKWILGRAAQVSSLEEWLGDVGKYMLNSIYGSPLFPLR